MSQPENKVEQPPIVGVGCSAGGLASLLGFFGPLRPGCGAAFFVLQHLDPSQPSGLPELLARGTQIRVVEAIDNALVTTDTVYVCPAGKRLRLEGARIRLSEPLARNEAPLPIDALFTSLAAALGSRTVGVLLSGMGSDGVAGLHAIREVGGLTLVQDPDEASAESMPRAAIDAGVVDLVAPADELVGVAVNPLRTHAAASDEAATALAQVTELLRAQTGNDFSLYKPSMLLRRVDRRRELRGLDGIGSYVQYLRDNPNERELLFKELLIGVTCSLALATGSCFVFARDVRISNLTPTGARSEGRMARQPRLDIAGGVYHVMMRGADRALLFRDDEERELFLERVGEVLEWAGAECLGWALMPNHVHLILVRIGEAASIPEQPPPHSVPSTVQRPRSTGVQRNTGS